MDSQFHSTGRRQHSIDSNCMTPEELHRIALLEERHHSASHPPVTYCPSGTSTIRSVRNHNDSTILRASRAPNIAFVIDLLETATYKGTLTDAEAISAFDQWLTDRATPTCYSDSGSTSQRLVTSDDSGIGSHSRCYHSDSCPSAQTSISDSSGVLSTASEPSLSPRPPVRRSESLNHRHRSTGRIFVKNISRLFAACGAPKSQSPSTTPPSGEHPWRPQQSKVNPNITHPNRRISTERPLPEVPVTASNERLSFAPTVRDEPIYAEYDVFGNSFPNSPSPPAVPDDFDNIYEEADELQFQESSDTIVPGAMAARPFCEPGHVRRLDSGIDSV